MTLLTCQPLVFKPGYMILLFCYVCVCVWLWLCTVPYIHVVIVQCNNTIQPHCFALGYNTIQYNRIQYNTIQYNNTMQYNTMYNNAIPYNTIQYHIALPLPAYNTIIQHNHIALPWATTQYNIKQYNEQKT